MASTARKDHLTASINMNTNDEQKTSNLRYADVSDFPKDKATVCSELRFNASR